jgi:hypothetical protein
MRSTLLAAIGYSLLFSAVVAGVSLYHDLVGGSLSPTAPGSVLQDEQHAPVEARTVGSSDLPRGLPRGARAAP